MMTAHVAQLFALVGSAAVRAASVLEGCGDFGNPDECINTGCLWLVIEGRCSGHDDPYAQANPQCCIGGEGSPCARSQVSDYTDGDCRIELPTNGKVTEAPPLEQMQRFAYIAAAAYCDQNALQQWACGTACDNVGGFSDVSVIAQSDFQAVVAFSQPENAVVVSFRGSLQDIPNWAANLNYFKKNPFQAYPEAGVHEGFYNAWLALRDPVLSAITSVSDAHGVKILYATGHSLGGALAVHAAFDLSTNFGFDATLFSFGQPRTGDYKFSQAVLERVSAVYRVTHRQDIVPHVPLQMMGFYHLSSEVFFPDETGVNHHLCDGTGEDKTCANDCGFLGCVSVPNHLTYMDIAMSGSCSSLSSTGDKTVVV